MKKPAVKLKHTTLPISARKKRFFAQNLKGLVCIYQQTSVDTFSKGAFAKLYTTTIPVSSAASNRQNFNC